MFLMTLFMQYLYHLYVRDKWLTFTWKYILCMHISLNTTIEIICACLNRPNVKKKYTPPVVVGI